MAYIHKLKQGVLWDSELTPDSHAFNLITANKIVCRITANIQNRCKVIYRQHQRKIISGYPQVAF